MKVFKFGGGVLRTSKDIDQLKNILKDHQNDQLIIVVSAFNKITSKLERLLNTFYECENFDKELYDEIKAYHIKYSSELYTKNFTEEDLSEYFEEIQFIFKNGLSENYHYNYDKVVSFGEILSSRIVYEALRPYFEGIEYYDARKLILTDSVYTEAKVEWEESVKRIREHCLNDNKKIIITQGFIAADKNGDTTTLGREGSDFTASILAYAVDADEVVFWKEVDGVYNADPQKTESYDLLPKLSYKESVEQAFYGAKILHPKTIKPLQNKSIPIKVKPFLKPSENGTDIIDISELSPDAYPNMPIYIIKEDQLLLSLSTLDFSFISENNLGKIFNLLSKHRVKVNLMESSAISFSVCVNNDKYKIPGVMKALRKEFKLRYNDGLSLITIRHYTDKAIEKMISEKTVLIKQSSRHTVRFVVK